MGYMALMVVAPFILRYVFDHFGEQNKNKCDIENEHNRLMKILQLRELRENNRHSTQEGFIMLIIYFKNKVGRLCKVIKNL